MNTVPKTIGFNPFRIFGVYANSPKKDILANKGKAIAFLKVNRAIEFSLDLNAILPPLLRTIDLLNEAEGRLAIAKEQIKYSQFWFLKITQLDDIAFNYLISGDTKRAIDIWSKQETLSSLQNKTICHLTENKLGLAIKEAEILYEKYGDDYIAKVDANCTIQMSGIELFHQFIDTLGSEIGYQNLISNDLNEETIKYINSQTIDPIINRILSEVERSKNVVHDDAKARIESARKLVRQTKEAFATLKKIMKANDPQFQMIADKLGLEILQCGIDYFNNSDDDERHQTAMKMQKYARSIVVGSLAIQRCDENIKILQKIIDELPPVEALIYEHYIENSLSRFENKMPIAIFSASNKLVWLKDYLKECGPYIGSIREIAGANHPYYLKKSTDIVDYVLTQVIDIVNSSLDKIKESYGYHNRTSINELRNVIRDAWQLTLMMDRFDVHPSFKQVRYLPNRNLLKDIVDQTRIYVGQPESIDMRSERQMYLDCTTITDCDCYQKLFPHGKYEKEVQDKKQSIRFKTCKTLKDCDDLQRDYPHRKIEIDALREKIIYEDCHTLSKCEIYLKKYPNGKYKSQVEKKIDDLIKRELDKCESIDQYESFINFYSNSKYVDEAQERIDELIRSRRRKMIRNTIIWILVSLVIAGIIGFMYWDSNRKIEIAEQRAKQAEYNLYDNIVNKGDSLSCSRFIDSYPNSEYVGEVMKVLEDYNYHHLSSLDDCLDFVSKYPRSKYMQSVDSLINERAETLKKALLTNKDDYDLDAMWDLINKYGSSDKESIRSVVADVSKRFNQIKEEQKIKAEKAREDSIRKEEEAKKRAEYEKYGTDANAWKTATSAHTITAYQDYLTRYPRGKHVETANKYIIDLEVQKVINSGDYGHLPSSQKMSYETGRYSTIHISSRCDRTITIMYSGVKSMKIVLGSYQSRTIVLPSSTYKVVATASGVRSFYGTENLTGGDYESEYYISTTRY